MKVVLLANVPNLGRKFEIKNVALGYARNYLLPNGFATFVDRAALKRVELLKRQYEMGRAETKAQADRLINQLAEIIITIKAKANDQGHLFEGVSQEIIAEEIKRETKIELDPDWLLLDRPIKAIGDYEVNLAPPRQLAEAGAAEGKARGKIKIRVIAS